MGISPPSEPTRIILPPLVFINAEKLYEEIISLPLYYAMTDEDVESVIRAVTKIAEYYAAE